MPRPFRERVKDEMKRVISASRRTDLVAFFPQWLASVLDEEKARVVGPSGFPRTVDLRPESVHTLVLWSKDFRNLLADRFGLREILGKYAQVYCHFTITGLGGTGVERGVPAWREALFQLGDLVEWAGDPERISLRFDPVVYWQEGGKLRTNLHLFKEMAPVLSSLGIRRVRISFVQWYGKAVRRAAKHGFAFVDPDREAKLADAAILARVAADHGLQVFACSQDFLGEVSGIQPSSCIDGRLLQRLHPDKEPVSTRKDPSQRKECRCTESTDIGSYTQSCPHACLYCYANPRV